MSRLFFFCLSGLVALAVGACSSPPATVPPGLPTQAATQPPAGSMGTAQPSGPTQWAVAFVQNGQVVPTANYETTLAKAPFTIRLTMSQPAPVKLNVWLDDQNFQALNPGYVFPTECWVALCTGMDVAEELFGAAQNVMISPEDTHYWYYLDAADHRWSHVNFTPTGVELEREVRFFDATPVAQFDGQALFFLFYVDQGNPNQIDENELQKLVVFFQ